MDPDLIASAVFDFYYTMPNRGKPQRSEWTVLAGVVALILEFDPVVVCVATWTRCIGKSSMKPDGTILHDCHAEVLARRCLIHQTYLELIEESVPLVTSSETETTVLVFYALRASLWYH